MSTDDSAIANAPRSAGALELIAATVLTIAGAALTTYGAFAHVHTAFAPGSTLIFVGAAWLGNALARRGTALFPAAKPSESTKS